MIIDIILEQAPKLIKNILKGNSNDSLLKDIVDEVVGKTGATADSEDEKEAILKANPDLIREVLLAKEKRLLVEAEALKEVWLTNQIDAQSDHWFQRFWRPFIGWAFGVECAALITTLIYLLLSKAHVSTLIDASAFIISILTMQAGVVGYYQHLRTKEKESLNR